MAPHQVRITLLGGFDVKVDGTAVPAGVWRLSKARSLVKLLALAEGNSMHRDAVVEALWPDLGAAAATNNLHQAMHSARRARDGPRATRCPSAAGRRRCAVPRRRLGD